MKQWLIQNKGRGRRPELSADWDGKSKPRK